MKELVDLLRKHNLTIASIESLTAGLFASSVAEIPGASNVLKGALVTYQTACKIDVLKIDRSIIKNHGVVSKEVAQAMTEKGFEMFKTDIVVSCTGNAGPDVLDGKPVGMVCMAILSNGRTKLYEEIFSGTRNEIREKVVYYLVEKINEILK